MPPVRPRLARAAALTLAAALLTACSTPDGAAPAPTSTSPTGGVGSQTPEPPATSTATLTADGIELLLTVPTDAGRDAGDDAREGAGADAEADEPAADITVTPDEDGSSRVAFVVPVDGSTVPDAAAGSASSGADGAASAPSGADRATTDPGGTGTSGGPAAGDPAAIPATIDLVSPADGSFLRNGDGSLTVLDAAGTPLGGFAAPQATDAAGAAGRTGFVVVAPTRAQVHAQAVGATPSGTGTAEGALSWTVSLWLGTQGVRSATWGEREGGRSLAVDATPWARQSGIVGEATAWAQLVASEPEADSRTMRDQFDCHALGAPDKATWNLEPWRPDVGFLAMAAARCNPT